MVCYFLLLEKAPESHPVEAAQHKKNKLSGEFGTNVPLS